MVCFYGCKPTQIRPKVPPKLATIPLVCNLVVCSLDLQVRVGALATNKAAACISCPDGHPDLEVQATQLVDYFLQRTMAEKVGLHDYAKTRDR